MLVLASALALLAAVAVTRHPACEWLTLRVSRWEAPLRRFGPWIVAMTSIAVVWVTWDAFVPVPSVTDENSYLLQADIFARLRWTMPSPPIPEFFEQPHVQVVPALASKYPPGHALLLALGARLGFHALVPLLLAGVTAALLFALTDRLTNPWTALLAWLVWLTAPIVLQLQPSYFSEVTTAALVLLSWWLLLNWRETRRTRWLALMALVVGWGAITRPLTMLAFAVPIGVVVLRDVVRLRLWRDFALAFTIGSAVLAVLPLWSARTTGDWRISPIERYRQDYWPFDKVGFAIDTSPPRRALSPGLKATYDYYLAERKRQTLSALPLTAVDRSIQIAIALFQEARLPLMLFAIAGLFLAGTALRFTAVSALVLFLAHLPYAHLAKWTVYYLEAAPVVAALTAVGIWGFARRLGGNDPRARTGVALTIVVVAAFAVPSVVRWKLDHRSRVEFQSYFTAQLKRLPSQHAILFLSDSSGFGQHVSMVINYPDLKSVPVWVVHDLGPRNEDLRRLAPDRASFEFNIQRPPVAERPPNAGRATPAQR